MRTLRTRSRIPLTIALAGVLLVGTPLVTGCSLINTVVDSATGGNVPEGLGLRDVGSVGLPERGPADRGRGGLRAVVARRQRREGLERDDQRVRARTRSTTIKTQLTDAGFEYQGVSEGESGSSGVFRKDDLTRAGRGRGRRTATQWTANYTVTNAETSQ